MIIKTDKEGHDFLVKLADAALKGAGIQALQMVNQLGQIVKVDSTLEDKSTKTPEMDVVRTPVQDPEIAAGGGKG